MPIEGPGPSAAVLAERKREDNLAKDRLEAQRRMTEAERIEAQAAVERAEAAVLTEQLRLTALSNWKGNGGTEAEFAQQWPQLRLQLLQQKALNAQAEEKADIERRIAEYGGRF